MTFGTGGLSQAAIDELELALAPVDAWAERRYPGGATTYQPVHTVYVPADRAEAGLCAAWGAAALAALEANAPMPALLAEATELEIDEVAGAWDLMRAVLAERPIQDLRIDLEDGYGAHPDEVEDEDAQRAARVLLAEAAAPGRPMRLGIARWSGRRARGPSARWSSWSAGSSPAVAGCPRGSSSRCRR